MRVANVIANLLLVPGIVAQGQAFTVPAGTSPSTGTCNSIPWGDAGSSIWSNQRYQVVVPASDLGAAGFITGLEFAPCGTGTHTSSTLTITIGMVPNGFQFGAGNVDFAANLASASGTTVVLDQSNYSFDLNADNWTNVGFTASFPYDGASDLLIDILTAGNTNLGAPGMRRADDRQRLYAVDWTGIPPVTGTTDLMALKMRVLTGCAELSTFGLGCAGLELSFAGAPALGGTLAVDMSGGAATSPAALDIGLVGTSPFPIDLSPFGLRGCLLYTSVELSANAVSDGAGNATLSLPVPSSPALTGARLFFQWVHLNDAAPGGAATSNAGVAVLGPQC